MRLVPVQPASPQPEIRLLMTDIKNQPAATLQAVFFM
jgi:hypothetical protein